ncbi:MAG: glycosyltransferase family 2 protein [Lachnospiraceae bacterium]|nr:glycosyltransferase family 2 protein [Lachnospiraceae bacterium]
MEPKKISIISIIYQVEPYLRQCLDSLLAQTYSDLEFILVVGVHEDAAKNDRCLEICEEYAKRDARIILVKRPAKGIADARNAGIEAAHGDLIGFVDGDDWVEPDMFAVLVDDMDSTGSDVAVCGRYYEFQNHTKQDPVSDPVVQTGEESMRMILSGTGYFLHLWDKLFVRRLWEGVVFPTDFVVEDRIIVGKLLGSAERICYRSTPKYHFRERGGSNSKRSGMEFYNAEANRLLCEQAGKMFPGLKDEIGRFYLQETLTSLQNLLLVKDRDPAEVKKFVREIRSIAKENADNPLIGKTLKIKTQLARFCPALLQCITRSHQKRDKGENIRYE